MGKEEIQTVAHCIRGPGGHSPNPPDKVNSKRDKKFSVLGPGEISDGPPQFREFETFVARGLCFADEIGTTRPVIPNDDDNCVSLISSAHSGYARALL